MNRIDNRVLKSVAAAGLLIGAILGTWSPDARGSRNGVVAKAASNCGSRVCESIVWLRLPVLRTTAVR